MATTPPPAGDSFLPPLKPAGVKPAQKGATPAKAPDGDLKFTTAMNAYEENLNKDLFDLDQAPGKKRTAEEYFAAVRQAEKDEAALFRKEFESDQNLSANQKKAMMSVIKGDDFDTKNEGIVAAYRNNPNDPNAKAAYEQLHKDMKEYQALFTADDSPFKDDKYIKDIALKQAQVDDPNFKGDKNKLKHEINEEFRDFQREQATPEGEKKYIAFVETNRGNKVIQESGMLDMADSMASRLGIDTKQYQKKTEGQFHAPVMPEIGEQPTTALVPPKVGAVETYTADGYTITANKDGALVATPKDEAHKLTAKTEIVITTHHDADKAHDETKKYTVADVKTGVLQAPQTPAADKPAASLQK
jgi:hypothetical protein